MKISVLGCGKVGRTIADKLSFFYEVDAIDASIDALRGIRSSKVNRIESNIFGNIGRLVEDSDLVIGAVPGIYGMEMLEEVIHAGKDIVDISFPDDDHFRLDEMAREKGSTCIVDCGIAPGYWNMIASRSEMEMDRVDNVICYVGGLPLERKLPWEYKAGYSIYDVLEMFLRESRIIKDGKEIICSAMSDLELIDFPKVGTLEAFNSDGLRTLLKSTKIPNIKEKTLRYPGHVEKMKFLIDIGMLSKVPIRILKNPALMDSLLRPIDAFVNLISDEWKFGEGEIDITLMKVIVEGRYNGKDAIITHELMDEGTPYETSMARTTGYTAAYAAIAYLEGMIPCSLGIVPPEDIGKNKKAHDFIVRKLRSDGIQISTRVEYV